jgi:hypothetical protein
MAGDPLSAPTAAASDPVRPIAAYLAELDAALSGTRRACADVLDEVHDGLLAATDRHRYGGATALEAEQAALAEFGRPELVARAFAGELATARARRLLVTLLLTGPLVGVWWLLLLAPHRWPPNPGQLVSALPVLPVVGLTVAAVLAVLAGTGGLSRRLPALTPRRTVQATRVLALTCLAVDVAMLALLLAIAVAGPGSHEPALMLGAAVGSLARLTWIGHSAHWCRRSALSLADVGHQHHYSGLPQRHRGTSPGA